MAITAIGVVISPIDSASGAGPLRQLTVSTSTLNTCVTGDIVYLIGGYKNDGVTFTFSGAGQTWNHMTQAGGATSGVTIGSAWCRFNGTWSNDSINCSIGAGTLALSCAALIFRPTTGTNVWTVVNAIQVSDNAASLTSNANSITLATGDLAVAAVLANDDNTFTNNSGGTFTTFGTIQNRNLQGNDISMGFQYRIEADGSPVARTASWSQSGSDSFATLVIGFHEGAAPAGPTTDGFMSLLGCGS
jgi:hypothetical protein